MTIIGLCCLMWKFQEKHKYAILYYNQLLHKLSHSYMFRHYRVILREFVISTLQSYTGISYAAVGNTIYN